VTARFSFFIADLLGREFPDDLLRAQEAIALGFGYDNLAKARKAFYQAALDETPDRRDAKAKVICRFIDLESAPIA